MNVLKPPAQAPYRAEDYPRISAGNDSLVIRLIRHDYPSPKYESFILEPHQSFTWPRGAELYEVVLAKRVAAEGDNDPAANQAPATEPRQIDPGAEPEPINRPATAQIDPGAEPEPARPSQPDADGINTVGA